MESQLRPVIVNCFFDKQVDPPLSAMELRWNLDAAGNAEQTWHLPGSLSIKGPPPIRFGVTVSRRGADCFAVRLLWNELTLHWSSLKRTQILASALTPILRSLGTDVWHLLQQPVEPVAAAA